jgi:predicted TIM-barrel fold metal-dependent hydrolase
MTTNEGPRADAHIHVFEGGYRDCFTARPGVSIDEAALFTSLAADHGVAQALVVGYAAFDWCAENNAHLAAIVDDHDWLNPTAFVVPAQGLDCAMLDGWHAQGFVGLSLYVFSEDECAALAAIDDDCWRWLSDRRWLVSVNSKGAAWDSWVRILMRHPELRLLVSHVGLPPAMAAPPCADDAVRATASVLQLAAWPGPRVKLSGFYALTEPGHDYPHRAAWPYVEALLAAFGSERLLWASDFSPSTEWLSYPQTYALFDHMPFLTDSDRAAIRGSNLLTLLDEVDRS